MTTTTATTTTTTTTTTTITTITTTRITTNENNNKKNKITTPDLFNNHKSPAKAPAFDRTKVPTVDQAETGVALGVWIIIWQQNSDQLIDKKSGKDTAHGYAPSPAGPNHRSATLYTMEAGAGMGTRRMRSCSRSSCVLIIPSMNRNPCFGDNQQMVSRPCDRRGNG